MNETNQGNGSASSGIGAQASDFLREVLEESNNHYESIVRSVCDRDEKVLAFQLAETRPHFLICIIPFIPDLLTRPKKFLLALSNRRLIIIQLTNPFNKLAQPGLKKLVAAYPHAEVNSVIPKTGVLTSAITISVANGRKYRYKNMLKSAAETFSNNALTVRQMADAS